MIKVASLKIIFFLQFVKLLQGKVSHTKFVSRERCFVT